MLEDRVRRIAPQRQQFPRFTNFTVQAGDDADLLASTIELSSPDAAVAVAGVSPYRWPWIAGAGALSAAGLGIVVLRRRKAAAPTARSAA